MNDKLPEYTLIPMSEIDPIARKIAVAWAEGNGFSWIGDKHKLASDLMNYAQSKVDEALRAEQWIKMSEQEPDWREHKEVLLVLDYTEWGRGRYVRQADVHFEEKSRPYGGPNSLIGSGNITGLYFSLPGVIPKEIATHWKPMPALPK